MNTISSITARIRDLAAEWPQVAVGLEAQLADIRYDLPKLEAFHARMEAFIYGDGGLAGY